jgi:lysine-N-methylase
MDMVRIHPDFYPEFHCIAGQCKHSCCIGWEIDVDEDTMEDYQQVGGAFGERLHKCIAGEESHFVLGEGERCPFLNGENLCDIIINLGEDSLCQICADHPRFYTWLPDRVEEGLGLCCEEAARLLLSHEGSIRFLEQEEPDEEDYEADEGYYALLRRREKVFACLQDRTRTIQERLAAAFAIHGAELEKRNIAEDIAFLDTLEILDEHWRKLLRQWTPADPWPEEEAEHLLVYLVYRYYLSATLEQGDALFPLRFGAMTLGVLAGLPEKSHEELVRMWSAELEYSEENLERIAAYLSGENMR